MLARLGSWEWPSDDHRPDFAHKGHLIITMACWVNFAQGLLPLQKNRAHAICFELRQVDTTQQSACKWHVLYTASSVDVTKVIWS